MHPSCQCALTLTLLCQEDDCVIWTFDDYPEHISCGECLNAIAYGLRDRRHWLKDLALRRLPPSLISSLALDQYILLDRSTSAVIGVLLAIGNDVPLGDKKGICNRALESQFDSPRHAVWLFQALFDVGFQNIDAPDASGATSLQKMTMNLMSGDWDMFGLGRWIVHSGADEYRPLLSWLPTPRYICAEEQYQLLEKILERSEKLEIKVIHVVAFVSRPFDGKDTLARPLIKNIGDASTCSCGPVSGWTPFTYFLALTLGEKAHYGDPRDVPVIGAAASEVFSGTHRSLGAQQYRAAFRFMTHEALELQHSMCVLGGQKLEDNDDDDDDEYEARDTVFKRIVLEFDILTASAFVPRVLRHPFEQAGSREEDIVVNWPFDTRSHSDGGYDRL